MFCRPIFIYRYVDNADEYAKYFMPKAPVEMKDRMKAMLQASVGIFHTYFPFSPNVLKKYLYLLLSNLINAHCGHNIHTRQNN